MMVRVSLCYEFKCAHLRNKFYTPFYSKTSNNKPGLLRGVLTLWPPEGTVLCDTVTKTRLLVLILRNKTLRQRKEKWTHTHMFYTTCNTCVWGSWMYMHVHACNCLLQLLGICKNTHRTAPWGCGVSTVPTAGEECLEKGDGAWDEFQNLVTLPWSVLKPRNLLFGITLKQEGQSLYDQKRQRVSL